MKPQKWKLISSKDVSPSKWFPIEERTYLLPDGTVVDDFTVTTLGDFSLIIPVTPNKEIILINEFKPGADEVMLQFPAGMPEDNESGMDALAQRELEEETGIRVELDQLSYVGKFTGFSTKGTQVGHFYIAKDCIFNSHQHLDTTENIEIVTVSIKELDRLIESNKLWCAHSVAGWELAKRKFPELLS
jgi:ADP-ribose pyrophosphatase